MCERREISGHIDTYMQRSRSASAIIIYPPPHTHTLSPHHHSIALFASALFLHPSFSHFLLFIKKRVKLFLASARRGSVKWLMWWDFWRYGREKGIKKRKKKLGRKGYIRKIINRERERERVRKREDGVVMGIVRGGRRWVVDERERLER